MKVSDIIQRQIDHVRSDDLIERAAIMIFATNTDAVPVCRGKKVVGVVTRENIYKYFFSTEDKSRSANENTKEKTSSFLSIPITKIMTRGMTVKPDTSLIRTHEIMDKYDVEKLPVVDDENKLIGAITKVDVFRALISQRRLFPENEQLVDFLSGSYFPSFNWANRFKHEIPDLVKLFKKNNVKTILDIGCFTGELSIELANQGFSVVGIDRNSRAIDEANKNKTTRLRKTSGNVNFWCKDAEDFMFDFDLTFDAIIFMNNSISHNPNNFRHLIKRASSSLSDSGIMVFQIFNFEKTLKANNRLLNFHPFQIKDQPEREYAFLEFLDNPVMDKEVSKNFITLVSDKNGWQWAGGVRSMFMAYADELRIKSVLKNEGFSEIATFGANYDLENWDYPFRKPFKSLESDWLNVIATK